MQLLVPHPTQEEETHSARVHSWPPSSVSPSRFTLQAGRQGPDRCLGEGGVPEFPKAWSREAGGSCLHPASPCRAPSWAPHTLSRSVAEETNHNHGEGEGNVEKKGVFWAGIF